VLSLSPIRQQTGLSGQRIVATTGAGPSVTPAYLHLNYHTDLSTATASGRASITYCRCPLLVLFCPLLTSGLRRTQLLPLRRKMQRMQRITGRFLTRTPNEADVEAMLKDFNDSKTMLEKVRPVWLIISHCSVL
jgi:hypothetical protein